MILAELSVTTAASIAAATAFVSMLFVQVGKMIADTRKDRRDSAALLESDRRIAAALVVQEKSLERIANATEKSLAALLEMRITLQSHYTIAELRHIEVLAALRGKSAMT